LYLVITGVVNKDFVTRNVLSPSSTDYG
jgi:hypothetical protein